MRENLIIILLTVTHGIVRRSSGNIFQQPPLLWQIFVSFILQTVSPSHAIEKKSVTLSTQMMKTNYLVSKSHKK